ncbi:2-hydroxyacid dehydrogenase [Mycobacterium sp. NPDC003449]
MTGRPVVVATSAMHPRAEAELEAVAELRTSPSAEPAELVRQSRDADAVIVRDPIPEEVVTQPRLRAVVRHGAGLDLIPVGRATEAGVLVANVPGVNANSVAEHVMLAVLALSRRLPETTTAFRERGWPAARSLAPTTREVHGRTLGLVGVGNVGQAVARLAHGFGMRVLGRGSGRRPVPAEVEERTMAELLDESHVLVLACPLTSETRHLIDARALAAMQADAIVVNVARGPVVDDHALIAALKGGRIGGAALDVFTERPGPGHPYFELPNVLLTPHLAAITDDSMRLMGLGAVRAVLAVLDGELPGTLVNPEAVDKFRQRFPART